MISQLCDKTYDIIVTQGFRCCLSQHSTTVTSRATLVICLNTGPRPPRPRPAPPRRAARIQSRRHPWAGHSGCHGHLTPARTRSTIITGTIMDDRRPRPPRPPVRTRPKAMGGLVRDSGSRPTARVARIQATNWVPTHHTGKQLGTH